jgi:type IV pilus assembly protein PilN
MIRINLAPETKRRRGIGFRLPTLPAFNLGWLFGILYVGAIIGIGVYWWSLSSDESKLTADVARANTELSQLKATISQGSQVQNQAAELRKRFVMLEDLMKGQTKPIALVDAFADMIPKDLWITGLEERDAKLKVSGSAYSTSAVADFMANLRASAKFRDVDLVVSRRDLGRPTPLVTFEVTCRFEG